MTPSNAYPEPADIKPLKRLMCMHTSPFLQPLVRLTYIQLCLTNIHATI